ncbi:MAG: hypothetical protein J6K89_02195 [Oscillospiraceae bacterium]|nr:hypothetical protein [Oscillospiraceae bacterium]
MRSVNGEPVPIAMELGELEQRMASSDMQIFAASCQALALANTQEAYELLREYVCVSDPYRRRCVLAVIFDYEQAVELKSELVAALRSEKHFLVTTALDQIVSGKAMVEEEELFGCIERNHNSLSGYYYGALMNVQKTAGNLDRILRLYHSSKENSIRTALAQCLQGFCNSENYLLLFDLFKDEPVSHIRMVACRIAKAYGRGDLLRDFADDRDGHIRKLVSCGI